MKKLIDKKQKKGILITLGITLALVTIIGGGQAYYKLRSDKADKANTVVEELDTYNDFYNSTENLNKENSIIIASKDVEDYQGADSVYTLGDMTYLTYSSEEQAENALNLYKENGYTAEKDVITEFNLEELEEEKGKINKENFISESQNIHTDSELESLNFNPITVAVLDSGINPDDEIKDRIVFKKRISYENGDSEISATWLPYEWGGASRQFEDSRNHGTQIAKIIAENTNANVQIASYNIIDDNGKIYTSALISAIYDCIAKDVKVINMSLTTRGYSEVLEYAIKDAMEHGIIVVAAAGNYGEDASGYTPANISGVITVGASDKNENIEDYSNYGADVDCIADGNVYSADGNVILKGTSFSAARVSAYAARIIYGRSTGYVKYILDYVKEQTGNNITYESITKALNNVGLLEKINIELSNKDYETIVNSTDYKQMIKNKFEKEMTFSLQGLRGGSEHWGGPYIEGHGQTMSWGPYVKHGSDPGFRYGFSIDRSNDYYDKDAWYFGSAAEVLGHPVEDRSGNDHTVCHNAWVHPTTDRSADDSSVCDVSTDHGDVRPSWSALWDGGFFRACQVGVTYEIGVGDPGNPSGYTFDGWSVTGGSAYTSESSGYKYAHVGVYEDDVDFYETWNCNHSASVHGHTDIYESYGECSGSSGYVRCNNCGAHLSTWDTRVSHNWQLKGKDNASQHWYQCSHNGNHTKGLANHTYNSTPSASDNYNYYYDCTVCGHRKAETRYYTINYYIRNENADGSWGGYWHWYSQNYTYGQTWSYSGYTNDTTYKPISGSGTVVGDQNVYIDAYRNRHNVNYYVRNQNPDGTWGNYWYWYSESKRYEEPYSAIGYNGDINYKQISASGTMYGSDITEYMDAYRQIRNMDFNVYVSEDGSDSNYDTHYICTGDNRLIWDIETNGGNSSYNRSGVTDWCEDVRTQAYFKVKAKINVNGYHIEKMTLRDNASSRYVSYYWGTSLETANRNGITESDATFNLPETWHNQEILAYIKPNIYYYKFNLNKPLKATNEPEIIGADTIPVCYNNSVVTSASEVTTIHSFPTAKLHGWNFIGWNTKADGTGDWYTTDTVFNKQTSDLNLYAQWSQTQYTVRLSANVDATGNSIGTNLTDRLDNSTEQNMNLSTYQDSNNNLTLGNITWKYHEDGNNSYYEAVFTYDEPQSIYDYDAYFHLDYFVGNGWYYNGNKINGISQSENNTVKSKFNLIDLINNGSNYLDGPGTNIITLVPLYKINSLDYIATRSNSNDLEKIDYYRRFYTGQTVTYDMLMLMNPNKNKSNDAFRLINSFTTLNLSDLSSYPITKTESVKTSGYIESDSKVNPISVTDDFSTDYVRDNLRIESIEFKDINGNSISSISGDNLRNLQKSGIKVPDNARSYEVIFTAIDDGWVEVDESWNNRYSFDYVKQNNGGYKPNNGDNNKVYKQTEPRTVRAKYVGKILQNNAPTLKETPIRLYEEQIENWTKLNDVNKEVEELKSTILKYQVVSDFEDNNDKLSNWYKSEIQSQKLRNNMTITDIHKGTRKEDGSIEYNSSNSIELKKIIENIHDIKDNQYYEVTITIKDSFDKETKSRVHLYVIYNPADFDVDESNNINRMVYMPTNITGNYTLSDSIISHNLKGTGKEGLLNSSYSKVDGTPVRTEEYEFNSGSIYGNKGSVKIIEY